MTTTRHQKAPSGDSGSFSTVVAWVVALLASALGDILCVELAGSVPFWLLLAKVGMLGSLILMTWFWKPIEALRPFFIMLLAITSLMRMNGAVLNSPAWMAWQQKQSFAVAAMAVQLLEMGVAFLLIGLLFALRKRRQRFFLIRGDRNAMAEPVRWFGQRSRGPLWSFGLVFTLVVVVAQYFMFMMGLSPSFEALWKLLPLVPVILLLAATNGFSEEITMRAAPMSTVYEVVGRSHAVWIAATLFGLAHYIGGMPSGLVGVLITVLLGWFFGKCMLDSRGLFWPWLFHTLQDILPFTAMALAAPA